MAMGRDEAINLAVMDGATYCEPQAGGSILAYRPAQSVMTLDGKRLFAKRLYYHVGGGEYAALGKWEFCEDPCLSKETPK